MKILWVTQGRPSWPAVDVTHIAPADFDPAMALEANAVLVGPTVEAERICRKLRQHAHPLVYLKPLFVLEDATLPLAPEFRQAVDGAAPASDLDGAWRHGWRSHCELINAALAKLPDPNTAADTNPGFKALRWLFSRDRPLEPMATSRHAQGYIYPPAELFVDHSDGTMNEMLAFLESQGILAADFVDRIFRCASCKSAFLNVREGCSQCHSTHLETDDLVHHFRCGHVAPMADFSRLGLMSCPKCERELSMIGVDYDKPSTVYRCLACNHVGQEVETLSTCYRCGRSTSPEGQEVSLIRRYRRNGLSESVALFGLDSLFRQIVESEIEIVPLPMFKRLVQLEIDRIARYKRSESTLLLLELVNLERVYRERPGHAREIFCEMVAVLKSILRTTDIVTTLNDAVFIVLLVETPEAGASRAIARVQERLDALLGNNLGNDIRSRLRQRQVGNGEAVDQLLNGLLGQLGDADE